MTFAKDVFKGSRGTRTHGFNFQPGILTFHQNPGTLNPRTKLKASVAFECGTNATDDILLINVLFVENIDFKESSEFSMGRI